MKSIARAFKILAFLWSAGASAQPADPACETERTALADLASSIDSAVTVGWAPALGPDGPLGAYGPLGTLGPIGDTAVNPSFWMDRAGDWSEWSDSLTARGGPLSADGPLGPEGPIARHDEFPEAFRAGGRYAVLGPAGPLGALGPLGPLGRMGAHGSARDRNGSYVDDGEIVRTATVDGRTFELHEHYTEPFAKRMADNDTSFMATGTIAGRESDDYPFTARADRWVTVNVVPEKRLDRFDLEILGEDGTVLARSDASSTVNFVHLRMPAGTKLTARVSLQSSAHWLSKSYRLVVTGF